MKTLSEQNLRDGAQAAGKMPTTHWSTILMAGQGDSTKALQALESLCHRYWYPLYAYLRRQRRSSDEAYDLTQGFFTHLISQQGLSAVEPREGLKFRSWLLTALRHFVNDEWRKAQAQRRGGGQAIISFD